MFLQKNICVLISHDRCYQGGAVCIVVEGTDNQHEKNVLRS